MPEHIEVARSLTASSEHKAVQENLSPSNSSISSEKPPAKPVDGEHDAEAKQQCSLAADSNKAESQTQAVMPLPYTGFSPGRRHFILGVTTVAGFFGPLAGGIYLPALPVLEEEFHVDATAINATVSVFMLTFAFGVSHLGGHPIAPIVSSRWMRRLVTYWLCLLTDRDGSPSFGPVLLTGRVAARFISSLSPSILLQISFSPLCRRTSVLWFSCAFYRRSAPLRWCQWAWEPSQMFVSKLFQNPKFVRVAYSDVQVLEPKKRAFGMSIFLLGPQCGPVLGPVIGGAFAGQTSWRWIFGFLSEYRFLHLLRCGDRHL
jgi:MFS family permease